MTMSLGELDVSCGMLGLDLCIFLGCGDELQLVLEYARRVIGRGASFGFSSWDRMRLRPWVGEWHRRCGRWARLRVLEKAMES